jgi:predicted dinucleotide-binding enzyme
VTSGAHRPLLPVAADDDSARRLVAGLATEMGFDAVEISGLDNAGLLEEAARYWGLLAYSGGLGRSFVLVAHQRPARWARRRRRAVRGFPAGMW